MQVINLKLESNMKEEMLEAIYGTVERLEQKVDELSASQKYAGAETVPAFQFRTPSPDAEHEQFRLVRTGDSLPITGLRC